MSDTETVETEETTETTETETETAATETETTVTPPSWSDSVKAIEDENLRKVGERFNSQDEALRAIANFQKREGQVRVPGKDAGEDEVAAFHKAIGVPDEADAYEFPELPEEQMTDDVKAFRSEWAKTFHELKVPADQAKALAAKFHEQQVAAQEALVAADKQYADEQVAGLKKEWGGDYERNAEMANRALAHVANEAGVDVNDLKTIEMKDGRFLLDNAAILKLFAKVGSNMREGDLGTSLDSAGRDSLDQQIKEAHEKSDAAMAKNDHKEADRWYAIEQELIAKRDGNRDARYAA